MKFEDFLMQRKEEKQKRIALEEEASVNNNPPALLNIFIKNKYRLLMKISIRIQTHDNLQVIGLQADLVKENNLNRILQCALHEPIISRRHLPSWLPLQVQMLLAEVDIVEQEIVSLERKVEELKIDLYDERKQNKEWQVFLQQQQQHQWMSQKPKHHICRPRRLRKRRNFKSRSGLSFNSADFRCQSWSTERKDLAGLASDMATISSQLLNDKTYEDTSKYDQSGKPRLIGGETCTEDPNKLSEDLINCLIGIFLQLNRPTAQYNREVAATVPKLGLSCINSNGLVSKTSFNCKAPTVISDNEITCHDPFGTLPVVNGQVRDIGPYNNFLQFTRSSLDMSRLPECFPAIGKLRVLMYKLSTMDLSFLTYKQKLAFWINIYNACIMHAYLQHGLPSTTDKQLALMNKAALNVGGIVLNALAIEHFILRHPYESNNGALDEKEKLLWHAYGLGYPEPNVTFALCRGSWSSPALRTYTAENVANELGKAKVEYLEASVGVTSKKKIMVPKLLHWHMRDFADNMESLLEWIYSQLPRSGSVSQLIIECLNGETRTPITKMVEIQLNESEFRYLLPQ